MLFLRTKEDEMNIPIAPESIMAATVFLVDSPEILMSTQKCVSQFSDLDIVQL